MDEYRPKEFKSFIGQKALVDKLTLLCDAASERNQPLDHTLFFGPPGLGKTTLAEIIADRMKASITTTTGPAIANLPALTGLLLSLSAHDILFIDEIHRLKLAFFEYLYPAMDSFRLSFPFSGKTVTMTLPPFTLIGATTNPEHLPAPLRSRFGIEERIDFYPPEELADILREGIVAMHIPVTHSLCTGLDPNPPSERRIDPLLRLAMRSRGTPRRAKMLLRRARDIMQAKKKTSLDHDVLDSLFTMMGVYKDGLIEIDRKIIETIISEHGGPIGLDTIAAYIGESPETVEEVYEPYLIRMGFIHRTPNGRIVTKKGYEFKWE